MVWSASALAQVRDEVGTATDFSDATLEDIYTDQNRGGSNVYKTAIIVWKRRLATLDPRSFDAAVSGQLVTRSQRVAYIERRIMELQFKLPEGDFSGRAANDDVLSTLQAEDSAAEF